MRSTSCSVKAYGRYRRARQLEVTICDLKFFDLREYRQWKGKSDNAHGWTIPDWQLLPVLLGWEPGEPPLMPTRNVNLTDHFDRFIEAGVRSGRFSNSEVVREGLRLLEQREQEDKAKLEWLRAAAQEGFDAIERGDYVTLRSPREIEEFVRQIGEEVSAELAGQRQRG